MTKKFIIFFCLIVLGVGSYYAYTYFNSRDNNAISNKSNDNVFDETKAISMIIKDHADFPSNPSDTIVKKISIGGRSHTDTTDVKFMTEVQKDGESAYIVTLTKDWGITVNGKYVKSLWRYKVTPNNISLLDFIDNEDLPKIIK